MKIRLNYKMIYAVLIFGAWIAIIFLKLRTNSSFVFGLFWLLLGGMVLFLNQLIQRKLKFGLIKEQNVFLIFVMYTVLSTIINRVIGTTNNYQNSELIFDSILQYLLPLLVLYLFSSLPIQSIFFRFYRNFMVICSLMGLFEYLTKIQIYQNLILTERAIYNFENFSNITKSSYRLMMFFYHPIYYGLLLVLALIVLLYIPYKSTIIQFISIILIFINILLTKSRSSWLVAIICFAIFIAKRRKISFTRKRLFSILKVYGLIVFVIIGIKIFKPDILVSVSEMVGERIMALSEGNGTDIRIANILIAKNILADNFGILLFGGGNMYAVSYLQNNPTLGYWTSAIDNQYITCILNYGIVGLTLFLYFFYLIIKRFIRQDDIYSMIASLSIIAIMLLALFFEPYGSNIICYIMMIFVSMLSTNSISKTEKT